MRLVHTTLTCLVACLAAPALATTFDIGHTNDLFVPTFRGDANTTYLGWDLWDDVDPNPLDSVNLIDDLTPDLGNVGTDGGRFMTTNGEDHLSDSANFYSGAGSMAEAVTFDTAGVNGSGYTTVIIQAKTLFGGWGVEFGFTPINGVAPSQVLFGNNLNAGQGQLFVKYEIPGTADPQTFSMVSGPFSFTSFDHFVIDTVWSADGFAPDNAIFTPEPTSALLVMMGLAGVAGVRRW